MILSRPRIFPPTTLRASAPIYISTKTLLANLVRQKVGHLENKLTYDSLQFRNQDLSFSNTFVLASEIKVGRFINQNQHALSKKLLRKNFKLQIQLISANSRASKKSMTFTKYLRNDNANEFVNNITFTRNTALN